MRNMNLLTFVFAKKVKIFFIRNYKVGIIFNISDESLSNFNSW